MVVCENSVRERAYYIWEGEGRVFGRAEAHWLQAEAELRRTVPALEAEAVAAPVKAAKPRASRAKAVQTPVTAPAKTVAKTVAKIAEKAAEKPAAKAVKAAPKTTSKTGSKVQPAAGRAKSRAGAEAVVLH